MKQLINFPTRGEAILDLILTKLKHFYQVPNSAYLGTKGHVSLRGRPVDFAMHATSVAAVKHIAGSTIPNLNVETSEDARLNGHTGDRTRCWSIENPTIFILSNQSFWRDSQEKQN